MLAHMGQPNFDAVSLQTLQTRPYTANPINGSDNASNQLTPGTVIAIRTNAGATPRSESTPMATTLA